jgi:hypothetical protein
VYGHVDYLYGYKIDSQVLENRKCFHLLSSYRLLEKWLLQNGLFPTLERVDQFVKVCERVCVNVVCGGGGVDEYLLELLQAGEKCDVLSKVGQRPARQAS